MVAFIEDSEFVAVVVGTFTDGAFVLGVGQHGVERVFDQTCEVEKRGDFGGGFGNNGEFVNHFWGGGTATRAVDDKFGDSEERLVIRDTEATSEHAVILIKVSQISWAAVMVEEDDPADCMSTVLLQIAVHDHHDALLGFCARVLILGGRRNTAAHKGVQDLVNDVG